VAAKTDAGKTGGTGLRSRSSAGPLVAAEREIPASEILAPENLPFQLHLLVQGMTRRMQKVLDPFDLTPLHWGILCCLWRKDGLSPTEIAGQLSQLGGTITVALQALEKRKLILRRARRDDRRAMQIYLTARGRALQQVLVPLAAGLLRDLFSGLSPAEYDHFAGTVRSLRAHIEQRG
jgi:DNA-binding MarR family transcriptional regulator